YKKRMGEWLRVYVKRIRAAGIDDVQRQSRMNTVNPKYVFRNYLAQLAIDKAEAGDFSMVEELLELFRKPYAEQPDKQQYAEKRPDWARTRAGCSMLSCSS
ncbi:MAG: YdiU family protein, partial [Methylococcales bacterium]|nr:YdiU family protein [Methylococcales bacterium]